MFVLPGSPYTIFLHTPVSLDTCNRTYLPHTSYDRTYTLDALTALFALTRPSILIRKPHLQDHLRIFLVLNVSRFVRQIWFIRVSSDNDYSYTAGITQT